jgi:Uma2 family endonuclease
MAAPGPTRLTYDDLQRFPDDNLRRELIDGELFVSLAPMLRHQEVVMRLGARLLAYVDQHGGKVYPAPTDVFFVDDTVLEPDIVVVGGQHLDRLEERFVRGAPDLVVEVSSPSTRRLDLVRKRAVYERFGVPEFWFIDLDTDRVERYQLAGGRYGPPAVLDRDDLVSSPALPGWSVRVAELVGPWPQPAAR